MCMVVWSVGSLVYSFIHSFTFISSLAAVTPHSSSTSVEKLGNSQTEPASVRSDVGGGTGSCKVGCGLMLCFPLSVMQHVVKTCLFARRTALLPSPP